MQEKQIHKLYRVIYLQIDKPACNSECEQYRTVWINLNIKMIRKITIRFFHRYILLVRAIDFKQESSHTIHPVFLFLPCDNILSF